MDSSTTIPRRAFGRMGWSVSELGFGAWTIGGGSYGDVAEADAVAAVEAYLDAGGNFIDTARGYRESERILGEVFQRRRCRDDIVLSTKTGATEPTEIREQVETSLRLLQTDHVEILHMHGPPDPEKPDVMNRTLDTFEQLRDEGKVRAIAASISGPNVGDRTGRMCHQYMDTGRIDAIQLIYSIFRQRNREVFARVQAEGVALIARTALESGFLSGKYTPGHTFADHRHRWSGPRLERILQRVQDLKNKAVPSPYESLAEVAYAFALAEPEVSTLIFGARDAAQAKANLAVAARPGLPDDLLAQLKRDFADVGEDFNPGDQ